MNWIAHQARLDAIVDTEFGEPIELHPWSVDAGGGITSSGGPDPDRDVFSTFGVYVKPGSQVMGESGNMGGSGGPVTREVVEQTWASISQANLGDISNWHVDDRVFFPQRNEWYTIGWVSPSATNRPNIMLIRVQAADV